ncbi:hypothetical protein BRADI_4g07426v3 [Brachypodium distachyon]|uniref:Uncharacterized protein n=1 Tax=Brachypodium distachyon TaxID=15368 RepID=A0A2K2CL08_BRADI|nr:hypothetical protein BRADI_4g07426v3 [Brachypodium distachyon]
MPLHLPEARNGEVAVYGRCCWFPCSSDFFGFSQGSVGTLQERGRDAAARRELAVRRGQRWWEMIKV